MIRKALLVLFFGTLLLHTGCATVTPEMVRARIVRLEQRCNKQYKHVKEADAELVEYYKSIPEGSDPSASQGKAIKKLAVRKKKEIEQYKELYYELLDNRRLLTDLEGKRARGKSRFYSGKKYKPGA